MKPFEPNAPLPKRHGDPQRKGKYSITTMIDNDQFQVIAQMARKGRTSRADIVRQLIHHSLASMED